MVESIPLISVITVCLNAEEYIEQCILSVINQEYKGYEYIIIDGGSSDRTVEIIKKYSKFITYWHTQKDDGIGDAFNQGVEVSKGKWLSFLNSDDLYADNLILKSVEPYLINHNELDVIFGQMKIINRKQDINKDVRIIGSKWNWSKHKKYSMIPHPASFTNREYFIANGMFDVSFSIAIDYELFLRVGANLKTLYIKKVIAYMRDDGISKKNVKRSLYEGYQAQIKNKVLSRFHAILILLIYSMRHNIKIFIRQYNK